MACPEAKLPRFQALRRNIYFDGGNICRACHSECNFGCMGQADSQCISQTHQTDASVRDCKNLQFGIRCVETCPNGWYPEAGHCLQCHEACNTCDTYDSSLDAHQSLGGYTECTGSICGPGHYRVDNGLETHQCVLQPG